MRTIWQDILSAFVMGMVVPSLVLNSAVYVLDEQRQEIRETLPAETEPEENSGFSMHLRRSDGSLEEMDLETYLTGVVLAEMPAEFEPEALKAQAVAARTYTVKAGVTGGKHGDGSVCGESSCCQAYITEESYLSRGGNREDLEKIQRAVRQTGGEVLTYDGELIEATYFSCSGGSTEDAAAVWGTDFPYLQSVSSPGEEGAAYYRDTVTFTPAEFQSALGRTLEGQPSDWFGLTAYTEGGGVSAMNICGESYSGTRLRSLLGLRSAAFTVEATDTEIRITTKGYGHRVGMSQYGADAMAVTGSSYARILSHYYPGTVLTRLRIDETGELEYSNA